MADDLTVLFVGDDPPDNDLLDQLEKLHVMGDFCTQDELPNMMGLADPHLLVHLGKERAGKSFEFLKDAANEKRVRLVVVAERKDLPELRKLDRSIVVSLLATDIAPSVIATRIAMLAKKGPGKTDPPPQVTSAPHAKSKPEPTPQLTPPHPTSSQLRQKSVEKTSRQATELPKVSPNPDIVEAKRSESEERASSTPFEQVTLKPNEIKPPKEPTPPKKEEAQKKPGVRVAVADQDVTRGDLIACAFREAGLPARVVPMDAAGTRWQLIRSFAPTILFADGGELKGSGAVWYQLFQADKELSSAKLVAVPFERIFNEETGAINLRTLIPQIPQLSRKAVDVVLSSGSADEDFDDRPTHVHPDVAPNEATDLGNRITITNETSLTFEDETVAIDSSALASSEPMRSEAALGDRSTVNEVDDLELDTLPPPAPAQGAPENSPSLAQDALFEKVPEEASSGSSPLSMVARSSTQQTPAPTSHPAPGSPTQPTNRAGRAPIILGVAAFLAVGCWFALKSGWIGNDASTASKIQVISNGSDGLKEKDLPSDDKQTDDKPELVRDPLWVVPEEKLADCEPLVPNLKKLRLGGVAQATLSWNKARKNMVRGDFAQAHRQMCEAALIHKESLALEGLAGLYNTLHAPEQAMIWVEKALKIRPARGKTLQLKGDVISQMGKPAEAREAWASALKIDANDPKTLSVIAAQYAEEAAQYLKSGAVSQAEVYFRRAATFDPKSIASATGLAQTFLTLGHLPGAKAWAEKALGLKENHGSALVVLADLAEKNGDKAKALDLYRKALKTEPSNPRAHQQIYKLDPK